MRRLILGGLSLALLGAQAPTQPARSPQAQAYLDQLLAGRVAGETRRCLKSEKTISPVGVDDHTLLFKDGPRLWRNDLQSGRGCSNLGGLRALMTYDRKVQVCKGDRMYVLDMADGMQHGGCVLGEFTVYTRQKKKD